MGGSAFPSAPRSTGTGSFASARGGSTSYAASSRTSWPARGRGPPSPSCGRLSLSFSITARAWTCETSRRSAARRVEAVEMGRFRISQGRRAGLPGHRAAAEPSTVLRAAPGPRDRRRFLLGDDDGRQWSEADVSSTWCSAMPAASSSAMRPPSPPFFDHPVVLPTPTRVWRPSPLLGKGGGHRVPRLRLLRAPRPRDAARPHPRLRRPDRPRTQPHHRARRRLARHHDHRRLRRQRIPLERPLPRDRPGGRARPARRGPGGPHPREGCDSRPGVAARAPRGRTGSAW